MFKEKTVRFQFYYRNTPMAVSRSPPAAHMLSHFLCSCLDLLKSFYEFPSVSETSDHMTLFKVREPVWA